MFEGSTNKWRDTRETENLNGSDEGKNKGDISAVGPLLKSAVFCDTQASEI